MNDVKPAEDGKSATISGGASVKKVVDTLWAANKQTGEILSQSCYRS